VTILVTGATGFLGGHLIRLLVERGEDVRALVRHQTGDAGLVNLGVEVVRGEVGDRDSVRRAAADCGVVFHLAGLVSHERPDEDRLWAINVEGARAVVAALEPGARIVHVSSITALGPAPAVDRPVDETSPFPAFAARFPYAASKHAGEQVVLEGSDDAVIANPGFLLGPGDRYRVSTWPVYRYLKGKLRLTTRGGLSFCDARDVAAGLLLLAERGRARERYVLTAEEGNLTHAQFFRRVADVTGVRHRMIPVPVGLAVATTSLLHWPVKPGEARAATQWWFGTPAKAERELGFVTRPLDATIADTAADRTAAAT
jgi:nucleoside-diphosphate-sugar epimerase